MINRSESSAFKNQNSGNTRIHSIRELQQSLIVMRFLTIGLFRNGSNKWSKTAWSQFPHLTKSKLVCKIGLYGIFKRRIKWVTISIYPKLNFYEKTYGKLFFQRLRLREIGIKTLWTRTSSSNPAPLEKPSSKFTKQQKSRSNWLVVSRKPIISPLWGLLHSQFSKYLI